MMKPLRDTKLHTEIRHQVNERGKIDSSINHLKPNQSTVSDKETRNETIMVLLIKKKKMMKRFFFLISVWKKSRSANFNFTDQSI